MSGVVAVNHGPLHAFIACGKQSLLRVTAARAGDGDLTSHLDFQLLYEDNETNRMHESLNLFASIVNNIYFEGKPFIVFFNKFDLFEEKIKTSSLAKFFPGYQGDNRYHNLQ